MSDKDYPLIFYLWAAGILIGMGFRLGFELIDLVANLIELLS